MTVNTEQFDTYTGEPDIERLIRAFKRQEIDRVPNFEVLIEDMHVEKILGRYAGNTLAFGGDPAKGVVDPKKCRPMKPLDYIELCRIIGQDAMVIESIWPPYRREDKDGKLVQVFDRSIKNLADYRKLKQPDIKDINRVVYYIREYKEAAANTKIGVSILFGPVFTYFYEFLIGMHDFMIACFEDRLWVEEMLEDVTAYWIEMSKAAVKEGVDFIWPAHLTQLLIIFHMRIL
jgi:hypothetical protein